MGAHTSDFKNLISKELYYLKQEGVRNPLPILNNSPENKYLEAFDPEKLQSRV